MYYFRIVWLCLCLGIAAGAHAQWAYGIQVGIGASSLTDPDIPGFGQPNHFNSTGSLQAGVFARVPLVGKLVLQPELNYSRRGAENAIGGASSDRIDLNYLALPVLANFFVTDKFYLTAGPEVGVGLNNDGALRASSLDPAFDLGFQAGLGVDMFKSLGFKIAYTHGFVDHAEFVFTEDDPLIDANTIDYGRTRGVFCAMYYFIGR